MKKLLTVVVTGLLLTGCLDINTKVLDAQARYMCRDRGGVLKVINNGFIVVYQCRDGFKADYDRELFLPEGWRVGEPGKDIEE